MERGTITTKRQLLDEVNCHLQRLWKRRGQEQVAVRRILSMKPEPMNGALINDSQAAEYLGVTPRTLRQWREKRGLPHIRITAKTIRYRISDLNHWLNRFQEGLR